MCNIEIIGIPEFYVQNIFAYIRYFTKMVVWKRIHGICLIVSRMINYF